MGRKATARRRCWPDGTACPTGSPSICIVQAEDRRYLRAGYLAHLLAANRVACEADPSCAYLRRDDSRSEIPPHWRKAFIAADVLNSTSCRAIAWLDSDAVLAGHPSELMNLLRPLKDERQSGGRPVPLQEHDSRYRWPSGSIRPNGIVPHMVISGENDQYRTELGPFNAGVFILANTPVARALLAKWTSAFTDRASFHWHRNASHVEVASTEDGTGAVSGHAWLCEQRTEQGIVEDCDFGGAYYEQGAFVQSVLTDPAFRFYIRLVPWWVLQNHRPRALVHHFLGAPPNKRRYIEQVARFHGGPVSLVADSVPLGKSSGGGGKGAGGGKAQGALRGGRTYSHGV